jgi:hypothetical protein
LNEHQIAYYGAARARIRVAAGSLTQLKSILKLNHCRCAGLTPSGIKFGYSKKTGYAMTKILCRAERFLCLTLAVATALGPALLTQAQTSAAAMAVRQRVEGKLPEGPESSPPQPPGTASSGSAPSVSAEPTSGKLDTKYIAPGAAVVIVVRPSQILASPMAQVFPVEVVSAAATKNLGFDAAEMEEVVGFVDASNPAAPAYGTTFKFKNPIRATSIPAERRAHAQLAELNGKKYLRSAVPMMYSLYGPNNKTLVVATDAALHQLVESSGQSKAGPLMDRLREVSAGSDLYVAVDVASLRPFIQMGLAQAQAKIPPQAQPFIGMLNLVSAVELTLNVSAPGPSSLVVHCTDEAAAQKVESTIQEGIQKMKVAQQSEPPAGDDPIAQAMARYGERMWQPFLPQRSGTSITCFHVDGQNPAQQQLVTVGVIGVAVALLLPAVQASRHAAMRKQAAQGAGGPGATGGQEAGPQR